MKEIKLIIIKFCCPVSMLDLVRLETSGPTFRGLAVQVREATESATFSNDAAFVGQFVNPPMGGDWRIWSCDAVSIKL